jgi:hypothetical protein
MPYVMIKTLSGKKINFRIVHEDDIPSYCQKTSIKEGGMDVYANKAFLEAYPNQA